MERQLAKGHERPPIPDVSGKIFTDLTRWLFVLGGKSIRFFYTTGRLVKGRVYPKMLVKI